MTADDVRGEDYEAARPVPARSGVTGDPWVREHLPECDFPNALGCICPELRACEQRVQDEMRQPDPGINESAAYARAEGYAAGVQAAREAVAAVCVDLNPNGSPSTTGDRWTTEKVALAAIDALRARHA